MCAGLIGTGAFGREVRDLIAAQQDLKVEDLGRLLPYLESETPPPSHALPAIHASLQGVDAVILILWRSSERVCERLDDLAFATNIPWMPVTLEHPYLTVGPWLIPPSGPCFRCLTMRQAQHGAPGLVGQSVRAAYDADPGCGPTGHLPGHARLAAGLALRSVSCYPPSELAPGKAGTNTGVGRVTYHLESSRIEVAQLIACHGCMRCGTNSDMADTRSRLWPTLADLLGGAGTR